MSLIFRVNPPYQWLQHEGGRVDEFGEVAKLSDLPKPKSGDYVGVLDAEMSSFHYVDIPAKNLKQLTAAIPFALEETLTDDIEDLHFTTVNWEAGKPALVAVVAKSVMRSVVDDIQAAGINMDRMIPELLLVPVHEAANETLLATNYNGEVRYFVRSKDKTPVVMDEDFLDIYLQGIDTTLGGIGINDAELIRRIKDDFPEVDARHWAIGNSMNSWMEFDTDISCDLLHSNYQGLTNKKLSNKGLSWAAAIIGTAFILKCLFDSYEYFSLWKENRRLDNQMSAVVKEVFPEISNVIKGKERFIMEQQFKTIGGAGDEFQYLLAVIASASKSSNFVIGDVRFRAGALNLTCSLKDFSQVDKLTALLNISGVDVKLTSSAAEGGEVSARYTLRRKS